MAGVPPQLSVAVALPVSAGSVESRQSKSLAAGQAITGGVVSAKVMCCTQVLMLPQASVAFQVRSIPGWPVQLAAVAASVKVMVTVWPQLSVAVALPVLAGAVEPPQASTLSAGQVMTGAVVSWTDTVFAQVLEHSLPWVTLSVSVRVALQLAPAVTDTDWPLVDPTMEPLPLIDQA